MGMYTELVFAANIMEGTPKYVIELINYMIKGEDYTLCDTIDWDGLEEQGLIPSFCRPWLLSQRAYEFAGEPRSILKPYTYSSSTDLSYTLTIRTQIKNYHGEIESFIDWISEWVEDTDFAGYYRYEENQEPTLIYLGKVGEDYYDR